MLSFFSGGFSFFPFSEIFQDENCYLEKKKRNKEKTKKTTTERKKKKKKKKKKKSSCYLVFFSIVLVTFERIVKQKQQKTQQRGTRRCCFCQSGNSANSPKRNGESFQELWRNRHHVKQNSVSVFLF